MTDTLINTRQEWAEIVSKTQKDYTLMAKKVNGERAVLVTTSHRGVFFGYAKDTSGATIALRAARNCIYWPSTQKGFLGLAAFGPALGSRIGPAADLELRDITSVAACTDEAVKAWEAAPWSS